MLTDQLAIAQREFSSIRQSVARDLGNALPAPASPGASLGLALAIGARVLDMVTGQEGVIVDGTAEHIITGAAG